jgi:hypothetical protein
MDPVDLVLSVLDAGTSPMEASDVHLYNLLETIPRCVIS